MRAEVVLPPAFGALGWDLVEGAAAVDEAKADAEGEGAFRRGEGVLSTTDVAPVGDEVEAGEGAVVEADDAAEFCLVAAGAIAALEMDVAVEVSAGVDGEGGFLDVGFLPEAWFSAGVVNEVVEGEAADEGGGKRAGFAEDFFFPGGDPEVVAGDGLLENFLPLVVGGFVAAEDFGMDADDADAVGGFVEEAVVGLLDGEGAGFLVAEFVVGIEGFEHELLDALGSAVVVEGEEGAAGGGDVESLGGVVEVVAGALAGDLAPEVTFFILLSPLLELIDADGDELGLEETDDFGIGEGRRTVEHPVVSCAAERMSVHGPDEERFLFLEGELLRWNEGGLPGDGGPSFRGWLELAVEALEVLRGDFCGGEAGEEGEGEEEEFHSLLRERGEGGDSFVECGGRVLKDRRLRLGVNRDGREAAEGLRESGVAVRASLPSSLKRRRAGCQRLRSVQFVEQGLGEGIGKFVGGKPVPRSKEKAEAPGGASAF